jgi:hypothetical protein
MAKSSKFMKRFQTAAMRVGASGIGQGAAAFAAHTLNKDASGNDRIAPKGLYAAMTLLGIVGAAYAGNPYLQDVAVGFGGQALVREGVEMVPKMKENLGLAGVDGVPSTTDADDAEYWQAQYQAAMAEQAAAYPADTDDTETTATTRTKGSQGAGI